MKKTLTACTIACLLWSFTFQSEETTVNTHTTFRLGYYTSAADSGKVIYTTYCLPCHQADGRGVSKQNPPLANTDWVLGDKTRLIKVILNGLNEPVEINEEEYDNPMPPHNFLTDKQVADVLTYIRSSFGNKADAVLPDEVKQVREKK